MLKLPLSVLTILCLLATSAFPAPPNKAESGEKLVPRRVLILEFQNLNQNPDYDYLSVSIAETMSGKLGDTSQFEILPSTTARKGVKKGESFNEETAVRVGRQAKADVVVIGAFAVSQSQLQIISRAVDVSQNRVVITNIKEAETNSGLFAKINETSREMAAKMARELPPLPQSVIVRYRDGKKRQNTATNLRHLLFADLLGSGIAGSLNYGFLINDSLLFYAGGFFAPVDGYNFLHGKVVAGYSWRGIFVSGGPSVYQYGDSELSLGVLAEAGYQHRFLDRLWARYFANINYANGSWEPWGGLSLGTTF